MLYLLNSDAYAAVEKILCFSKSESLRPTYCHSNKAVIFATEAIIHATNNAIALSNHEVNSTSILISER
jgi:hypothetical protein